MDTEQCTNAIECGGVSDFGLAVVPQYISLNDKEVRKKTKVQLSEYSGSR